MNNSSKATSMAELLAKSSNNSIVSLKKGEKVTGTITKISSSEILLDIKGKTEGLVLENDKKLLKLLLNNLKVGDQVDATVINPESDSGYTTVSLRKFIDQKIWDKIKDVKSKKEKVLTEINQEIKGGYLVETVDGISGFLPQFNILAEDKKKIKVGEKVELYIVDENREDRKVMFSNKLVLNQNDFKALVKNIKVGEKITGIVSNITTFGMFLNIKLDNSFIDGIVHISEIAWEKVNNISDKFKVGEDIQAVVIRIDDKAKRLELSIKRLTTDPIAESLKKYSIDQSIKAEVLEINDQGILMDLGDDNIEGFIRKEKIPVGKNYKAGDSVNTTVTDIDAKKHRVYLAPVLLAKPLMYR